MRKVTSLEPYEVSGFNAVKNALSGAGYRSEFILALEIWNAMTLRFPRLSSFIEWRTIDGDLLMIAPWRNPNLVKKGM